MNANRQLTDYLTPSPSHFEISLYGEEPRKFDPNLVLDALIDRFGLKNDAALSRMLHLRPPIISKLRHRRIRISSFILIRIHEVTELSIREIRAFMGDHDRLFNAKE